MSNDKDVKIEIDKIQLFKTTTNPVIEGAQGMYKKLDR